MTSQKIADLISSYNALNLEESNLQTFMEIRQELVSKAYELGIEVGKAKIKYSKAYAQRKISYFRLLSEKEGAVNRREISAETEIANLREEEAKWEGIYYASNTILKQANEVLSALQQDISILKKNVE